MMPRPLTSPTVGLIPTMPFIDEGQTMEPSVSVPTAAAHRLADTATPDPELEPHGLRSSAYGLRVCPPRPLQPLTERDERKLAHSLRLVFPRITAPAARSRATTPASAGTGASTRASEPAVVRILSAVSMLSLISTGMPCSGPRLGSRSSSAAMLRASGLSSITDRSAGSTARIRARYHSVNWRAGKRAKSVKAASSRLGFCPHARRANAAVAAALCRNVRRSMPPIISPFRLY